MYKYVSQLGHAGVATLLYDLILQCQMHAVASLYINIWTDKDLTREGKVPVL